MPLRIPMVPRAETPTTVEIAGTPVFEEQYEWAERKALAVDTGGQSHTISVDSPKVAVLIVDGADMQVDTQTITADSPKLVSGATFSFTLKGAATTIYGKAVSGSGTLYIVVMN